eukprot:scaffold6446_cov104-Isochrysis_galbana.AAC.20
MARAAASASDAGLPPLPLPPSPQLPRSAAAARASAAAAGVSSGGPIIWNQREAPVAASPETKQLIPGSAIRTKAQLEDSARLSRIVQPEHGLRHPNDHLELGGVSLRQLCARWVLGQDRVHAEIVEPDGEEKAKVGGRETEVDSRAEFGQVDDELLKRNSERGGGRVGERLAERQLEPRLLLDDSQPQLPRRAAAPRVDCNPDHARHVHLDQVHQGRVPDGGGAHRRVDAPELDVAIGGGRHAQHGCWDHDLPPRPPACRRGRAGRVGDWRGRQRPATVS